jgi:vacuolar protein sorting-associated protein 13A/C
MRIKLTSSMVQYTTSGGAENSALAIVTIDSPKFILAVEPLSALLEFAIAPFKKNPAEESQVQAEEGSDTAQDVAKKDAPSNPGQLAFRVNIVHATILVLANDSDPKSQVIELRVKEILLSQQSIMAFKIDQLGMSFGSMDKTDVRVRFLDDLNVTMSLDTRQKGSQQMSSYEIDIPDAIIFRASYTDIMLITDIVNKAIAVATQAGGNSEETDPEARRRRSVTGQTDVSSTKAQATTTVTAPRRGSTNTTTRRTSVSRRRNTVDASKVLVSKEQLKATINGFQFVLVGDMQEIPMVHLSASEFAVSLQDWSGDVSTSQNMACVRQANVVVESGNVHDNGDQILQSRQFVLRASDGPLEI